MWLNRNPKMGCPGKWVQETTTRGPWPHFLSGQTRHQTCCVPLKWSKPKKFKKPIPIEPHPGRNPGVRSRRFVTLSIGILSIPTGASFLKRALRHPTPAMPGFSAGLVLVSGRSVLFCRSSSREVGIRVPFFLLFFFCSLF